MKIPEYASYVPLICDLNVTWSQVYTTNSKIIAIIWCICTQ